jgi:ribosomal protein S18 acetylase RimI-like enzyme
MEIASASPEDCRSVAELHVASWRAAYAGILSDEYLAGLSVEGRERSWLQVLAEAQSELLVGRVGASLVGFASLGKSRDSGAPPNRGELWALYVHPHAWSTGAGQNLWRAAHDRLTAQGLSSVSLWVLERNTRAIRFYTAAGFAIEAGSEKEFELGGLLVREVRMIHPGQNAS